MNEQVPFGVHHVALPPELVFQADQPLPLRCAMVMGCLCEVEDLGGGRGRIRRLLSTDPAHFLSPALAPGNEVSLA